MSPDSDSASPSSAARALDRLPPQALAMEAAVLGAMLLDRRAALVAMEVLRPEDFYRGAHATIFAAARDLMDRAQMLDQGLLIEELRRQGRLEEVGGVAAVVDLAAGCATSAHVESYAAIVADRALARRLIAAATDIVRASFEPGRTAAELVEAAEKRLLGVTMSRVGPVATIREILGELFARLEAAQGSGKTLTGLATGYRAWDGLTGGLNPGEVCILAGRPSHGKTSLALNVAARLAVAGEVPVAVFSLETTKAQVAHNLACLVSRTNGRRVRSGAASREEWSRFNSEGVVPCRDAPLFIDDCQEPGILELRARVRRLVAQQGVKLVIVDYLQLVRGSREEARESRQAEVAAVSRGLKHLARELDIPVLAVCQLNRAVEERMFKRPQLSDLRESGAIEQDADVVLLLWRPGLYESPARRDGEARVNVAKNRNGPVGDFRLTFLEESLRFEDYAPEPASGEGWVPE